MKQNILCVVLVLSFTLISCSLDLTVDQLGKELGRVTSPSTDPDDDDSGGGGGGGAGGPDIYFSTVPTWVAANSTLWVAYSSNVDWATITLSAADIVLSTTGTVTGCTATFPWGSNSSFNYLPLSGCTGSGNITISIKSNTAKNLAGDLIAGIDPVTIPLDAVAPTKVTSIVLGASSSTSQSPTITYTAGTDAGSGIAKHQVRISLNESPYTTIVDWRDHVSGTAITGLTLVSGKQYEVTVKAVDVAGNSSSYDLGNYFYGYTPTVDCSVGTPAIGALCTEGTIFAGTFDGGNYMTTPGGCTDSTTPTCSGGLDTLQKYWNDGTTTYSAVPGTEKISMAGSATKSSSSFRGDVGSAAIVAHHGSAANAAKYCLDMNYGGYNDWYLPSKSELAYLYCKAINVLAMHSTSYPNEDANCVGTPGGKQSLLSGFAGANYWSSTEVSQLPGTYAWSQTFASGSQMVAAQNSPVYVRCVRRY